MIVLDTGAPAQNPIPHRKTWKDLSVAQMIDLKNRLLDYAYNMPDSAKGQKDSLNQGVDYLDTLINAPRTQ